MVLFVEWTAARPVRWCTRAQIRDPRIAKRRGGDTGRCRPSKRAYKSESVPFSAQTPLSLYGIQPGTTGCLQQERASRREPLSLMRRLFNRPSRHLPSQHKISAQNRHHNLTAPHVDPLAPHFWSSFVPMSLGEHRPRIRDPPPIR